MRSSRVSLRPATTHVSVSGTPASTSAWRTCQPHAVATESASRPGSSGTRWPASARRWSTPSSASTTSCQSGRAPTTPARRRTRLARAPARASTSRAARSSHVGVAGQRGVGQAGAQAVVEPAVELDEAGLEARHALVALALEVGLAVGLAVGGIVVRRGLGRRGAVARRGPAGGLPPGVAVGPRPHAGRGRRLRHLALHPHDQQGERVLAGLRAAGAGAAPCHVGVVDHRLVRLAP